MSKTFHLVLCRKAELFLFVLVLIIIGQSNGRLAAADTITTNQLGQGVLLIRYHYDNLDGGKQNIYIADINLSDPAVSIAFPNLTAGRTVSAHAATVTHAAVAVNGQFFVSTGSVDFLKVHGTMIYKSQSGVHDEQAVTDDGLGLASSIRILLRPGGINSWTNSSVSNIMACGVGLVQNGVTVSNYDMNDPYITDKDPRTCVAQTIANHLLLMCVDGRTTNSLGMTIPQLRDYLFARGSIQNAFSLDGGGSTDIWARGIGVANSPSDGVERDVADAVVIAAAVPAIPVAPTNLIVTAVNTNISLSWALSSGAMSYNLKRSATSNGTFTTVLTTSQTSCTNTGLSGGTTYYYKVSATNTIGESANSAATNALTTPVAPANLAAIPGNSQVILSWNASPGATSYNISRATTSGGPYSPITQTSLNSITNIGVANGKTFYYVVAAVNSSGAGAFSAQIAATPQCVAPSAPPGLTATSGAGGVVLQWPSVPNVLSYTVNRAFTDGGPYSTLATNVLTTNYTDTKTTNGTVYFYTVSALGSCGASTNSFEASAPLSFVAPVISLTNFILRGWGGVAGTTYYLQASTNLTSSGASWAIVATNVFGASGSFSVTNPIVTNAGSQFYRIQTTQP